MLVATNGAACAPDDRRITRRRALGKPGTVRLGDGPAVPVIVTDLTRDGCRIETDMLLTPHQPVRVGLAHVGLTGGKIVWRNHGSYGCSFDYALAAGTVTAAADATNIAPFPFVSEDDRPISLPKWGPGPVIVLLAAAMIVSWSGIAALIVSALG